MPFLENPRVRGDITPVPIAEKPESPSVGDTFSAAFTRENEIGGLLSGTGGRRAPFDPDFDLSNAIKPEYREYSSAFIHDNSDSDIRNTERKIDKEREDRKTLESAGGLGLAASMAAGFLSPVTLVPVGGAAMAGLKAGRRMLEVGKSTAAAGFLASSAQEAALQNIQATRPIDETLFNIAGATALSGVLGGAVGLLSARQAAKLGKQLENELTVPPKGEDVFTPGESPLPKSAGAAATREGDEAIKGALGVEKALKFQDPLLRTMASPSVRARRTIQELAETPLILEKNVKGEATAPEGLALGAPGAVETRMKMWQAPLAESIHDMDDLFQRYRIGSSRAFGVPRIAVGDKLRGTGGKLSYVEFKEAVAHAMRNGDVHEIAEVAEAARAFRKKVFDPLKDRAIANGLLDEGVEVGTAPSYLNRLYSKEKIIANRFEFKSIVMNHLRRQDKLDENEIAALSDEIIDRILSTPDGRLPYDAHTHEGHLSKRGKKPAGVRGPLKARKFDIPDKEIEDFLEQDIEVLSRVYSRTMAADVEIAARFGDVEMTTKVKEVAEEFDSLIEKAKTRKERDGLERQKKNAIRDIGAVRDRLRGNYAIPNDPDGMIVRAGRAVRSLNYLRLLGGMTLSAIPDLAKPVMVHGMARVYGRALLPYLANLKKVKLAAEEVKLAGTALDMALDTRVMSIADIADDFGRHSKFERALHGATHQFGMVSLMAPWNAALKQWTGLITMTRIIQQADAWRAGKIGAKEVEYLASNGIDAAMAKRIADAFDKGGKIDGPVYFANTLNWEDRGAVEAFRAAVVRDVDRIIVTPGQDKPLWMSTELGKLVGQFKSFSVASSQRTLLLGLQQRDLAVMNGAALAMALGGVAYALKQKTAGREVTDDPKIILAEAFDRSGLAGWFMEANNLSEKLTRGTVGLSAFTGRPISRYASRNITGAMIGPTAGTLQDFAQVTGSGFSGDWREADTRALRRVLPLQNVFYMRWLFDKGEEGLNRTIGAK